MSSEFQYRRLTAENEPTMMHNSGRICYWNALMQALLSCTSIKDSLLSLRGGNTPLGQRYLQLAYGSVESSTVLDELVEILRRRNIRQQFGSQQESADEGLLLMMEMLPDAARECVMHRHAITLVCMSCRRGPAVRRETAYHVGIVGDTTRTPEDFAAMLMKRDERIDDYACEWCRQKTSVARRDQLTMIPEVLVAMFLDRFYQNDDTAHYFPREFALGSLDGKELRYRTVAAIHHTGTLSSGHYWATVRRGNTCYVANDTFIKATDEIKPDASVFMVFYHMI